MTTPTLSHFELFRDKMEKAKISAAAIQAFEKSYFALVQGSTGTIPEDTIEQVTKLPELDGPATSIRNTIQADPELLKQTVVLKLNGGLGTSMGLNQAKSLLPIKGDDTFLDLIAKQIVHLREKYNSNVKFLVMNSFNTSKDTLEYLAKYDSFAADPNLELLQNKVPKVDAKTLKPAEYPDDPSKEWCPPGHGDLYAALVGSGRLQQLLDEGYKYMFMSNSDNLGASVDLDLLTYFVQSKASYLAECCERTENDKKGGHLARRKADGRYILRDTAMCEPEDLKYFEDVHSHRYFHANNLWIRLDRLQELLQQHDNALPLPMIRNAKTVDPQDASTAEVYQLETAMGTIIEFFPDAQAICVPRNRFVPVKKCDELLLLRSDAYEISSSFTPELMSAKVPIIELDKAFFKLVRDLEDRIPVLPSLRECTRLQIRGNVQVEEDVKLVGEVQVENKNPLARETLRSGTYDTQKIHFG